VRRLIVRLRNADDVSTLSKRVGVDLTSVTSLEWVRGIPDLFGDTNSYRVRTSNRSQDSSWLDMRPYRWEGMPLYRSRKVFAHSKVVITTNLSTEELIEVFQQKITDKTKSIWYPKLERRALKGKLWKSKLPVKPRYPLYIISKGRWEKCRTAHTLDFMGLDYRIVVEPSEEKQYRERWGKRVLVGDFDTTTNSSIPVRNWVNEHCQAEKYWLLDDNINYFYILNNNESWRCKTGAIFAMVEDYAARYKNVALAGMNKLGFAKPTDRVAPYVLNTRVYSITLMDKAMNEKIKIDGQLWRGRYNEDTDLNIRFLKAGYCTLNFQMFLGDKTTTQRCSGGNTDTVYVDGDRRLKFAQSLVDQHPDVVEVVEKWGRYHHKVDWGAFSDNALIRHERVPIYDYKLYLGEYDDSTQTSSRSC